VIDTILWDQLYAVRVLSEVSRTVFGFRYEILIRVSRETTDRSSNKFYCLMCPVV